MPWCCPAISSREYTVILTEGDAQTLPELIKKLSRAILSNNNLHLRQSGIGAIMSNSQIKDALEYIALENGLLVFVDVDVDVDGEDDYDYDDDDDDAGDGVGDDD